MNNDENKNVLSEEIKNEEDNKKSKLILILN